MRKPLVLILGTESGPTDEVARAIAERCGDSVETRIATNNREAQRLVRQVEFVAIVATEPHFEGFCAEMVPDLTSRKSVLDVVICRRNPDCDYSYDGEPYGIDAYESPETAAAEVLKAVDHHQSLETAAALTDAFTDTKA